MDFNSITSQQDYWALFQVEQTRLSLEKCEVLFRPKSPSLSIIKARATGSVPVGHVERVFDSPRARELAGLDGWLTLENQQFDRTRYPELAVKLAGTTLRKPDNA